MCEEVVRVEVERIVVVAHRPSQVVEIDASQGTVDVAVHVVGLEVQRLGERLVSHLPFLSGKCHVGTCHPGIAVVWVEFQTLVEPFLSIHGVLLLQIHFCFQRVGVGVVLPLGDDGVQLVERLIIFLVLHVAQGTVEPIVAVARLQVNGTVVVLDGILVVVLSDAADGTKVVDVVDVRVELQCLGSIALGTHVVIERELRHAAEIPRLIEIRLGADSQVEILDGEHVVLIEECASSGGNQPIYPVLCHGWRSRQGEHSYQEPAFLLCTHKINLMFSVLSSCDKSSGTCP